MPDSSDSVRRTPLPVDECLPSLIAALSDANAAILQAPPGAGKTTRVPPALADTSWGGDRKIIVLEPRRMAARAAARRIAFERNARLGDEVGYQVRFDEKASSHTRILVVTEGIFLRKLQSDPFLEDVAAVIFDEFHERNLLSDLSAGMVRRLQQTVRPDLRTVIMSATLDAASLAAAFENCPVVRSEGRAFPVEVRYAGSLARTPLPQTVAAAVERALKDDGDVLVFLPGVGEIHRTAGELGSLGSRHDLAIMPLYGDMPPEEQDAVLRPVDRRKVVLATNVAETSLTIEGIRIVIDSGLARVMRFDPGSGLDKLELSPISRASAEQRAGRAGRTSPGLCWRLWHEPTHRARAERETPEIARVDLAGAVLMLKDWGESDALAFPWIESPTNDAVARAELLLHRLGATDEAGKIIDLGHVMAKLPVHPRLARLLVEGHRLGDIERTALLAAFLSERDPFSNPRGPTQRVSSLATGRTARTRSDVLDRLAAIETFLSRGETSTPWGELHRGGLRTITQVRDQLARTAQSELGRLHERTAGDEETLMKCLLAAYPDRVARRRDTGSDRGVMVGGRGVRLASGSSVTNAELFLCIDVMDAQPEAIVRLASAIERDWLSADLVLETDERFFHPTQKQVTTRRRVFYEDLLLSETPISTPLDEATAETLFTAARQNWPAVFPSDSEVAEFVVRVQCLAEWMPELGLSRENDLRERILRDLCAGRRSFADLKSAPWLQAFKNGMTYDQLRTIDREAPERITLPSGKSFRLTYEPGRPPVLAARIQDLFGLRETPRIANGRVKVLLHLLAPNMRPQQVTDDLQSFWSNTYTEVRKELRRRYPKHAWPENPLE